MATCFATSVQSPSAAAQRRTSVRSHRATLFARRSSVRATGRVAVVVQAAAKKVMIAGAPGCGKGTQCAKIVEKYGLVHVSVGDILRAAVKAGTPAGLKAKSFMDAGNLVPNEVVVEMVLNRLNEDDVQANGWLLDGYPRSGSQAEAIEEVGIKPDKFLLINVPDEDIIERVCGRRSDPETGEIYHLKFKPPPAAIVDRLTQRSDDTEEKAKNRLKVYHENIDSVKSYYTTQMVDIDGRGSMDSVFDSISAALD